MQPAICLLSVVPMRKEASHRSEMVSQILFGEYVYLKEEKDDFVFVSCLYDGYEGWVHANQLEVVNENEILETSFYTNSFSSLVAKDETTIQIPYASPVYNYQQLSFQISKHELRYLFQPQQAWNS